MLDIAGLVPSAERDAALVLLRGPHWRWPFGHRTGPAFSEAGRGECVLEHVALSVQGLGAIDLKPGGIATFLRAAVQDERGLLGLASLKRPPYRRGRYLRGEPGG